MSVAVVASIVAGEVGGSVPQARMFVACQVVRDAEAGRPMGPPRWNGWRTPGPSDIAAAERALFTDYCEQVPKFRFLGNESDLEVWKRLGYVREGDLIVRVRRGRWVVVGVLEEGREHFFKRLGGPKEGCAGAEGTIHRHDIRERAAELAREEDRRHDLEPRRARVPLAARRAAGD